ncbi:MAG: hypothetical protein AABZ55_14340 [Bdellovibrionota bacterium]
MKVSKIWDSADGAATPGRVFTASISQEAIPNDGEQLDYLKLGLKGAVSTAAVVIEDFADLLNPLTLRFGGENRIVLTGEELCALMAFFYGQLPAIGENTDVTGNDFLGGVKVPVYQKTDPNKQFTLQADRSAVTNIATETISVSGYFDTGEQGRRPIQCVRVAHTTAGSAGLETFGPRIVPNGDLIGLLLKVPSGFADGNIDTSVQKLKILADGKVIAEFNDLGDHSPTEVEDYVTPSPLADLLRQTRMFDLRPAGLDAIGKQLPLQFDVQDISDAIVVMPVIALK